MITTAGLHLLIPDKADAERDAVAESFARCGGTVHHIGRFWDPPTFEPSTVRVYGSVSFCLVLQQKLGFALCSPDDDLIFGAPPRFLGRKISRSTLREASSLTFPVFVKPMVPKLFRGAVYNADEELTAECRDLAPDTAVLSSEPVEFEAEARAFVCEGQVLDAAFYEGSGKEGDAKAFVSELAQEMNLPRSVVVDVGPIRGRSWAVIEFNPSWGAGLNGCDADKVLPAIVAASGPDKACKEVEKEKEG